MWLIDNTRNQRKKINRSQNIGPFGVCRVIWVWAEHSNHQFANATNKQKVKLNLKCSGISSLEQMKMKEDINWSRSLADQMIFQQRDLQNSKRNRNLKGKSISVLKGDFGSKQKEFQDKLILTDRRKEKMLKSKIKQIKSRWIDERIRFSQKE